VLRRHFLVLAAASLTQICVAPVAQSADPSLAENPAPTMPTSNEPHIALLLPLNSTAFRQPSEIVRQGFLAASKAQPDAPPVRVYPTTDDPVTVLVAYVYALKHGARVIVGPLAKNAVSALASSNLVSIPTLSLSTPDQENLAIPPMLYLFGLSIEEEARQIADMIARDGFQKPLIAAADSPLARRMQTSFAEHWRSQGRTLAGQVRFSIGGDLSALRGAVQKQEADVIFLAANAQEARAVRPYLASTLPAYATSQIFAGQVQDPRNIDLAGVRFIDMPWLLQPDHSAVMIYPHPDGPLSAELERLYALGIDALRLAFELYRNPRASLGGLDGVTGRLVLNADHQIQRRLVAAEFQRDSVVVIDEEP
jgi:outer membrane PBP1 activator LpoA protein